MITGERKKHLTQEAILEKISEYDIFRFYMPDKTWKLNQVTCSPFRNEHNPSFIIGTKHGNVSFIDFGDTDKRGNCFAFLMLLYNTSYSDVLKMIDKDFGLGICSTGSGEYKKIIAEYKQPEDVSKRYSLIQAITRKFTNEELEYWNQYYQSADDLRANNIYSIKTLFLNKQKFPLKDTDLRFGYLYDGHWKIYRPYGDKKSKWVPNNVPITAMDGKDDITNCDVAFITKSKKDFLITKKIFACSCAVQNEGIACFSAENIEYIKANSTRQVLGFDSDIVGVANSQQITKLFDFDYCNVPKKYQAEGIKDFADWARLKGLDEVRKYFVEKGLYS